jgi:hypothetical protein
MIALATLEAGHAVDGGDLLAALQAERRQIQEPEVEIDRLVQERISIGTKVDDARTILEANGFKTYVVEKSDRTYRLFGTQLVRTIPKFLPFLNDEYRIGLTIEDGKVTSVFGWIWLQAL